MANPNRCETCDYKKLNGNREKGHCYIFSDEPTDVCHQHTGRDFLRNFEATLLAAAAAAKRARKAANRIKHMTPNV